MEHSDLVAEMAHVEHLSTQDRLHLARRRRIQQLKTWAQREKEWQRQRGNKQEKSNKRNIFFSNSVMLLEAASRNDIAEVRRLLMKGVSADSTNEDGLTALHQCCIDDNEEMMMLLLEYGADVNAEDSEKWTPLHAAATCGHLHLVKYLIGRGANLLAVNADGNMPYDICEDEAALDHIEGEMARRGVTQELIDDTRAATELAMLRDMQAMVARGEDIEAYDRQGATPLHIAAANGYLRVVEYLLEQQVATGCKDRDEWQPVHAAACWGHLEVLELLVDKGADLNAKTKHDETPADICEDPELRERIVQLRSEQETRRQQDYQQRKGVHRTQSNTRTQSVRRTSIRDKTLTTKKDTVEEARLRFQEVFVALGSKEGDAKLNATAPDGAPRTEAADSGGADPFVAIPSGRRAPEGKDNDDDSRDEDNHVVCRMPPPQRVDARIEENGGDYNPSNKNFGYITDNGNVMEINVTVTINSGSTLADIKKQRSLIRNTNSPTGADSLSPSGGRSPVSEPPPAIEGPKRFTGNTGDMVGDSKTKRCCVVS